MLWHGCAQRDEFGSIRFHTQLFLSWKSLNAKLKCWNQRRSLHSVCTIQCEKHVNDKINGKNHKIYNWELAQLSSKEAREIRSVPALALTWIERRGKSVGARRQGILIPSIPRLTSKFVSAILSTQGEKKIRTSGEVCCDGSMRVKNVCEKKVNNKMMNIKGTQN